jgi:hypothetical protein
MSNPKDDWKSISVSLPARYWITVLALAEHFINDKAKRQFEELGKRGFTPDDLPDEISAVLAGPIFARGAIVDALCEAGIIRPEAKAKMGTDKLMEMAKKYHDRQRKQGGSK